MALASVEDVEARLGRNLTSDEQSVAAGLLDEASDLAVAFMRCTPDPMPAEVTRVVSRMVARVLSTDASVPFGLTQSARTQTAGAMTLTNSQSFSEGSTSRAPWLSATDKVVLRRFGCRGRVQNFPTA